MADSKYLIPGAIVVAGVIIAMAVYTSGTKKTTSSTVDSKRNNADNSAAVAGVDNLNPIDSDDHILGDPNAPVKLVEFVDLECPFCQKFHSTVKQVMDEYGKDGRVAWVYRHFPLESIHPHARSAANSIECANEIGGQSAFWPFIDKIFESGPESQKFSGYAKELNLDPDKLAECIESGKYNQKITDDFNDARNSGGRGTPYSIVIAPDGSKTSIEGAESFEVVKRAIENALSKK